MTKTNLSSFKYYNFGLQYLNETISSIGYNSGIIEWDLDGDGNFESTTQNDSNPIIFSKAGTFTPKIKYIHPITETVIEKTFEPITVNDQIIKINQIKQEKEELNNLEFTIDSNKGTNVSIDIELIDQSYFLTNSNFSRIVPLSTRGLFSSISYSRVDLGKLFKTKLIRNKKNPNLLKLTFTIPSQKTITQIGDKFSIQNIFKETFTIDFGQRRKKFIQSQNLDVPFKLL